MRPPEIRMLTEVEDLHELNRVWRAAWGSAEVEVPVDLLRALAHTGSYLSGAYDGDTLVGASLGVFAADGHLHSHATGVLPQAHGRGIGLSVKHHQRDWCLARGIDTISWTYDPLQRLNAVFNVEKIGARPTAYLRDFYGPLDDALNVGARTDRVLATWDLRAASTSASTPATTPHRVVSTDDDGAPVVAQQPLGADWLTIDLPDDANLLREQRPDVHRQWQDALADTLPIALDAGYRVVGLLERRAYLLEGSKARDLDLP